MLPQALTGGGRVGALEWVDARRTQDAGPGAVRALRLTPLGPLLDEVPKPAPGPGEVLLKVAGAGACHSDLHLMDDLAPGTLPWPPFTLGHETAGWVEGLGQGVSGLEVGEAVVVYGPWGCGRCGRCAMGAENVCERQAEVGAVGAGLGRDGGMAGHMIVPHPRFLVPIGDLDPVRAAPLSDAALTPYHAVRSVSGLLGPGSTAIVIGVGGLGHLAIQVLRVLTPAAVAAVDPRPEARAQARRLGAELVLEPGPDAAEALRLFAGGRGAEVVVDFVGIDDTLSLAARVVAAGGRVVLAGLGGGTLPVSFFGLPYEAGVFTTYWGTLPELREVVALAAAGQIEVEVTTYSLERALEAYEDMRSGRLRGRAVIVPGT